MGRCHKYKPYYDLLKDSYEEVVIINHFDLIVKEIKEQLDFEISKKSLKLNSYVETLIKEMIKEDDLCSFNINFEKANNMIKSKIDHIINFKNMTAYELNEFEIYKKKEEIKIQILDLMVVNVSQLI